MTPAWFLMLAILLFIVYFYYLIPVGSVGFLAPVSAKKGIYNISMGSLASLIYNRSPLKRRAFLIQELNQILRVAAFDPRIQKITIRTWLLTPFPQILPPPDSTQLVTGFLLIRSRWVAWFLALLANWHYIVLGKIPGKSSPKTAQWQVFSWSKETLVQWYNQKPCPLRLIHS